MFGNVLISKPIHILPRPYSLLRFDLSEGHLIFNSFN